MKRIIIVLCFALSGSIQGMSRGEIFRRAVMDDKDLSAPHKVEKEKNDKDAVEEMVLEALAGKKYERAERLLLLHPSLADDAKKVDEAHDTLRTSYKSMQDALLEAALTSKSLVPPVSSEKEVAWRELFFDRVLGYITYGVHSSKPAIVAASKNLAVLSSTQAYVNNVKKSCEGHNDAGKCPVCLEFSGLTMKKMLVNCNRNHTICVSCFNNSTIRDCALCRGALKYRKTELCQSCGLGKNLKFVHCATCDVVSVLCDVCTQLPCCGRREPSSKTAVHSDAIQKQALALIAATQSQCDKYMQEQRQEMRRTMEIAGKKELVIAEQFKSEAKRIAQRLEELDRDLEKYVNDDTPIDSQAVHMFGEHEKLMKIRSEQSRKAQEKKASLIDKMNAIKKEYADKIEKLREDKDRQIESIKAMAEQSTGSVLNIPRPSLLDSILADFSID